MFKELFESNRIDFKLAIPYPDDAEYAQKILKKKGIKSEVSHRNAVSYVMGKVKNSQKEVDFLDDLARDYDGDLFLG